MGVREKERPPGEAAARQIVLTTITGLLYPFCFPNFDLGVLAWAVLLPLHLALDEVTPRRAFWVGWLAGLIAFIGTMSWVVTAMHLYGKLPLAISYAVMALLTAYLGLYLAVYAFTVVWLRQVLPAVGFFGAPFVWVALELLRTHLFSGLPWALLGYSQYRWLQAIQIADVTGVYGVSFLVVLVNAALTEMGLWALQRSRGLHAAVPRLSPATAVLCMGLALLYGQWCLEQATRQAAGSRAIAIGLVQANIDQAHKWDAAYRRETLDRYWRLTTQVARGTTLVVWPEAATPFLFEDELEYREIVTSLVRAEGVPLLFGSPALRRYPNGRPYLLNSAYLLSSDGLLLGRYDKRHLVPFGEYIPLRPVLFFLDKLVEGIGDFEAGQMSTVLVLPAHGEALSIGPAASPTAAIADSAGAAARFGVVICFEVIFPNLVRQFVENGAEFMVTITNDAWFGASAAPFQHFGMVVFRAVENRVAFARAANTGVSGFIDPQGRILRATPIFTEAAVTGRIPVGTASTFYTQHGDVFAYFCAIISAMLGAAAWLSRP